MMMLFLHLICSPVLIAGVLGKENIFCSSENFLESVENPTAFCTISGIINAQCHNIEAI